jgi:F-type H+-transporting ATPase subunit delta
VTSDRIAARYALSLYDLAVERNELPTVLADFQLMDRTFANSRDLVVFLQSPILSGLRKLPVLREIFQTRVHADTFTFIELLAKKGRETLLDDIARAFIVLYRKRNRIQSVLIRSAHLLDGSVVERIKTELAQQLNATVELKAEVDPKLIGGFSVDFGDQIFDGSVAHALRKIEKELNTGVR